jgi:hypothetical protein
MGWGEEQVPPLHLSWGLAAGITVLRNIATVLR